MQDIVQFHEVCFSTLSRGCHLECRGAAAQRIEERVGGASMGGCNRWKQVMAGDGRWGGEGGGAGASG